MSIYFILTHYCSIILVHVFILVHRFIPYTILVYVMIHYFSILLLCLCHPALNVMFYEQSNISFFIIILAF